MMSSTRKITKLHIPHTQDEGINIVGLLEQVEPDTSTNGRRIALILHGVMGHKDYLFQKSLAQQLLIDSFRFDFRGNFETGGGWNLGGLAADVVDLQIVVAYLRAHYGYHIDIIVGHSRGSLIGLRWMCIAEEAKDVSGFVNVSGRYRMERIYDSLVRYKESFDKQGYYDWEVTVARQKVVGQIRPQDLAVFAKWESSLIRTKFPSKSHVLTIHGIADNTVPIYDAVLYGQYLSDRNPGTNNLCLIEDADHNFTNKSEIVVSTILEWLRLLDKAALHSGVWNSGGRL